MIFRKSAMSAAIILAVAFTNPVLAQSSMDLFNPKNSRNNSFDNSFSNPPKRAGNLPSTLFDIKLTDYEREKFDRCMDESKQGGTDLATINYASGFINAPYRDQSCTRFVVEKMLSSMEIAMKNDPEALAEFKRNKDAQKKYDELKKAMLIVAREPAKSNVIDDNIFTRPNNFNSTPNWMSTDQLRTQPEDYKRAGQNQNNINSTSFVPSEWWAKDYISVDEDVMRNKEALRQQIWKRAPSIDNSPPTPLQSIMQEAAGKQNAASQRGNPNAPQQ